MRKTIMKRETRKKFMPLLFINIFLLFGANVYAAEVPQVQTPYYAVMDAGSGEVIFSKNADIPLYPASSVKLVTAMTVLDAAPPDKVIVITEEMLQHIPEDAATLKLCAGGEYYVYELLQMLLISSAADAAQALAEGCFQSAEECVMKMNEKAALLGLTQTHFDNVIGLDIGNAYTQTFTTANEFVQLCRYAMSYDIIRQIVASPVYAIGERTNNPAFEGKSTNCFYSTAPYSNELYHVIGSKTGKTNAAGNVLITTATNGTYEIICVSFNNETRDMAYSETRKALDYTFSLSNTGQIQLTSADFHNWYAPAS